MDQKTHEASVEAAFGRFCKVLEGVDPALRPAIFHAVGSIIISIGNGMDAGAQLASEEGDAAGVGVLRIAAEQVREIGAGFLSAAARK